MKQFKRFPHKWALGANDIIKMIRIIVKIFSLFLSYRPASPVSLIALTGKEIKFVRVGSKMLIRKRNNRQPSLLQSASCRCSG